ncbi:MAG: ABC transporter permease [Planctomycetota bacterium]
MRELWRKELYTVAPFFYLMGFLILVVIAEFLVGEVSDQLTYFETYEEYIIGRSAGAAFQFVLTLAITSGLLVREFDDGTIEFLDAMPVGRGRIIFVKVICAWLVLAVYMLMEIGLSTLMHGLSRDSRDMSFHWGFLATSAFLRCCQIYVMVSLGVLFSYLRRFGWLLAGLMVWMYIWFHERIPALEVVNFLELTDPRIEAGRIVIPWHQLGVQLAIASVLYLVAYWLFIGAGDWILRSYQKLGLSWHGTAFLFAGGFALFITGFALMAFVAERMTEDEPDDPDEVVVSYPEWELARTNSEHYRLTYKTNLSKRALALAEDADEIYAKVRDVFGEQVDDPITIDATGSMERHAGRAHWNTVQMDLRSYEEPEHLAAVLGHETAHVMIDRLSDTRLTKIFDSIRFFHEGVATYVEYTYFEPPNPPSEFHRTAAWMRDHDQVHFRELIDNDVFVENYDTNAVYPIGLVFVEALVELFGEEAIPKICKAVAREEASRKLKGREFWQDTLQSCGYNLDDLLGAFYVRLDNLVDEYRDWLESVPKIRGAFEADRKFVHVRPVWKAIEGWKPFCRFRQQSDSSSSQYMMRRLVDGEFRCRRSNFPSGKVWYQVGLRDESGQTVFQPWREATIRD